MNNERTFAPARGSQPESVTTELPARSEAARRSQPAPLDAATSYRCIVEALRRGQFARMRGDHKEWKLWRSRAEALAELHKIAFGTRTAGPAGNSKINKPGSY